MTTLGSLARRVAYRWDDLDNVVKGYLTAEMNGKEALRRFVEERRAYTIRMNTVSLAKNLRGQGE